MILELLHKYVGNLRIRHQYFKKKEREEIIEKKRNTRK